MIDLEPLEPLVRGGAVMRVTFADGFQTPYDPVYWLGAHGDTVRYWTSSDHEHIAVVTQSSEDGAGDVVLKCHAGMTLILSEAFTDDQVAALDLSEGLEFPETGWHYNG